MQAALFQQGMEVTGAEAERERGREMSPPMVIGGGAR